MTSQISSALKGKMIDILQESLASHHHWLIPTTVERTIKSLSKQHPDYSSKDIINLAYKSILNHWGKELDDDKATILTLRTIDDDNNVSSINSPIEVSNYIDKHRTNGIATVYIDNNGKTESRDFSTTKDGEIEDLEALKEYTNNKPPIRVSYKDNYNVPKELTQDITELFYRPI